MTTKIALVAGFGLVAACARSTPSSSESNDAGLAQPSVVSTATTSATTTASATVPVVASSASAAKTDELRYELVTNPEIVPYCLPVPTSYLSEDHSERWEHGRKVFSKKSPAARVDLLGFCVETKLDAMFADEKKTIAKEPGAQITVSALKTDSYALSWSAKGRIHYEKTWAAKDDAGCFVRALFEYDPSDQPTFGKILEKVAAANPACPR